MSFVAKKPITLKFGTYTKVLTPAEMTDDSLETAIVTFAGQHGLQNFVITVNGKEVSDPSDLPNVADIEGTIDLRAYAKAGA